MLGHMGSEVHVDMGLGQHFTRAHVTLAMFNDKDVADTCRFENSLFFFKTIGYSNSLILENIIFTFEYFSIKDAFNNLGDYWPTHTNHKSERATFG